jgi:hypothetical protein
MGIKMGGLEKTRSILVGETKSLIFINRLCLIHLLSAQAAIEARLLKNIGFGYISKSRTKLALIDIFKP